MVGAYGASPAVTEAALAYLRIAALGLPSILILLAGTGVLRGLQDTQTPLYVVIAANLINIGLNFALVYGAGLGIAGSALGTLIAQTAAAAVLVAVIWTRALRARASWRFRPQGVLVAARSGLWLVLRTAALQTGITLTTFVAAAGGAVTLAAHQVVNSLWILLAFALDAIAIAGQAIIGRIAGRRRRGTRSGDDQPDDRLGRGLRSRVRAWPCGSAGRSSSVCSVPTRRCRRWSPRCWWSSRWSLRSPASSTCSTGC